MQVILTADVYAHYKDAPPTYRIWVDSFLCCEREFWPNPSENIISERIVLDLPAGQHVIKLQKIRPFGQRSHVWIEHLLVESEGNGMHDIRLSVSLENEQVITIMV